MVLKIFKRPLFEQICITVSTFFEKKSKDYAMVIIKWFGISKFSRSFFKICASLGYFCLGLPEKGKLINVHYFSGILNF
jgi:hypothetical protein